MNNTWEIWLFEGRIWNCVSSELIDFPKHVILNYDRSGALHDFGKFGKLNQLSRIILVYVVTQSSIEF